jgi:hypothetical protein
LVLIYILGRDTVPVHGFVVPNLRSDCRDLAKREGVQPEMLRAHMLCCCAQIDEIEEYWHAAERRARDAELVVALWNWLCEMNCTVVKDADISRADVWLVVDVDNEIVERGVSPRSAIERAKSKIEGRIPVSA